jgi:hypothetical protein
MAKKYPGYANGYYHLNTTKLYNAQHSIAWSVTDNQGRIEGIGSRLFRVRNTGAEADAPCVR